ncbi:MAG TPA: alpha-amylase family glycosyl hydrolase [Saprospiraceae bacterium]|nr:alpha-amylase family glycosyl hydrolase [Saprospiraceae bacterium]
MRQHFTFLARFCFVLLTIVPLFSKSQNAIVGSGFSSGWGGSNCPTGSGNFSYLSANYGSSFGAELTSNGTGNQYFRFGIDWSGTTAQRTINLGSDQNISKNTIYTLNPTCTTSGAIYYNVPSTTYRYIFKTRNAGTNPTGDFVLFEVQGSVRTISTVLQSPVPSNVPSTSPVIVTATSSGNVEIGQGVYLRYTTNNWTSSTIVAMSGSGSNFTGTIPPQAPGTSVQYYVFTSGDGLTISPSNADLFTINGNNNGGSNYSYTVLAASPTVNVSPSFPTDNQVVTITFNATGTALAGASKVYLHSGVSTNISTPNSFNYTIGNWGLDDGIGLMSNTGGDNWTITIPSLRTYYNVPDDKDIFGLNFLFRSANGSLKEDNNGANYYNIVDPGNYFTITFPTQNTHFALVNQSFNHTASASTAPTTWTLKELDPDTDAVIATITSTSGGTTFTHALTMTSTSLRKFRLEADFSGNVKFKTFSVIGYLAVNEAPRPSWTKLGINYHDNDATKATLVLHAPTYNRYKKGTGIISGYNTTAPKSVVYAIGDFNNWTPSEAFKMTRDADIDFEDDDNNGIDDDQGDYWWIELNNLVPGQEYVFQYLIDGSLQVADPYTHKVSDPDDSQIESTVYPSLITYRPQAIDRASVLQTNQQEYDWKAAPFTKPSINELNIYELHFRDFTEEGTYLAAIERLDYIKGLGINAIHVMPVSEFEGNSSWGYNPNFYFAADKAYGREDDLKKFIDECHKREIQVFNDLVLNHAFYSNVMARMYWNSASNKPANDNPWFNADHRMVADPAGWGGADWNHESEHTQKMMDRILDYWLQEFKFDGFRFDFTKGIGQTAQDPGDPWASSYDQDRIDLLERIVDGMKTRNPGSVVIFEHLAESAEDKVLADQGILMWSGVGHHNDLKGFILGYNGDNTNIYDSGVFNASGRDFTYANWMSYGESHDEERLGYEVTQFFNGYSTIENIVNRLKIAAGFNLLLPGPRMLWQFQELGYDVSINFNGRTGEKPVRWEYYDDAKRKELFTLVSRILKIRNRHNIYATTPDYGNIGLGAGNITTPRVMRFSTGTGSVAKHVIIVANLDPNVGNDVFPNYDVIGTWYRYNGAPNVDGTSFSVTNTGSSYYLQPSEMLVFTNFEIDACTDVRVTANAGLHSLRDAIDCAAEGDEVVIEFPVYSQTITLTSPIIVDKNITISGFPSKNVTVSGADFSGSVFSIAVGKSVNMNGFKISCAQGNADGRCLVNSGSLTLDDINMYDNNGSNTLGSSVVNAATGVITIENSVEINR